MSNQKTADVVMKVGGGQMVVYSSRENDCSISIDVRFAPSLSLCFSTREAMILTAIAQEMDRLQVSPMVSIAREGEKTLVQVDFHFTTEDPQFLSQAFVWNILKDFSRISKRTTFHFCVLCRWQDFPQKFYELHKKIGFFTLQIAENSSDANYQHGKWHTVIESFACKLPDD